MRLAKEKEIDEAIKAIDEKYKPFFEELEEESLKHEMYLWKIGGLYHDYSTFFRNNFRSDINDIIAVLLTYVEGEKFIPYSNADSIIIKKKVRDKYDNIDTATFDLLYKNGDLVMIGKADVYKVDVYNCLGDPYCCFGSFNYLREFMNRLIQYRVENNKIFRMTKEELYLFVCDFLGKHPNLVQKNKVKRDLMLTEQKEEDTMLSECMKLERSLNN